MDSLEFLGAVTPENGHLILAEPIEIAGAKTNPMKHHLFSDLESMVTKACQMGFEHKDVFFALAGFKEPKVWNPTAKNYKGEPGKWQTRTQANAGWLRTLFLDLDVEANPDERKAAQTYLTKQDALVALRTMGKKVGLPAPMVLDSGGGVHVYWPFDRDLPKEEWSPLAEKFKAICMAEGLKIDPAVPADSARVLRVLGCPNLKKPNARMVSLISRGTGPFDVGMINQCFAAYEQANGLIALPKKTPGTRAASGGYNNLQRPSEPIDFGAVSFACAAIGEQVGCRGAGTREPLWFMALGMAKMDIGDPLASMRSVSDGYSGYDEKAMLAKANAWNAGATKCKTFETECEATCKACPHYGKLTSPAQLARAIDEAPAPQLEIVDADTGEIVVVTLPNPPFPYKRDGNKIVRQEDDKDGNPKFTNVCPNDLYPLRILRQAANGEVHERTVWKFHLARMKPIELEMPQSLIAEEKSLHKFLLNAGVYVTSNEARETQLYMSAYLKKLANELDRERIYDRLGWQGEKHDAGFVVGEQIYHMDGTSSRCNLTTHVKNSTKNNLTLAGTFENWRKGMDWYLHDAYKGHRFFLYSALGAPLLHMTGHLGVMLNAVGAPGRGKTTCLNACGSIWGAPNALRVNGNPQGSTQNAQFNLIGTFHSLPVLIDEITDRDEGEMSAFALNLPSGRGKERMKGSDHDGKTTTWETTVLTTANSDLISRIFATRKDAQPHLMRVIGVDFYLPPKSSANAANENIELFTENYGHAGRRFMQYVTANYDAVKQRVKANVTMVNSRLGDVGAERFWVAAIAVAYTAGQIAHSLDLWGFPYQADMDWMCDHIRELRTIHKDSMATPVEALSEFLEGHIDSTLILSAKASSNLDNIVARPHRTMTIRHELDKNLLFISRKELQMYFAETRQNFKTIEKELYDMGIILDRNRMKTLGADTAYAKAQTRCWMINTQTLAPVMTAIVNAAVASQPALATGTV